MEVLDEYESPTPIFMDVLAATRHLDLQQTLSPSDGNDEDAGGDSGVVVAASSAPLPSSTPSPSLSKFFATSNDNGVPNLLYPLDVHPKEGVGRMIEEWQLAANKDTKRIMIRDGMRDIARVVVEATTSSSPSSTGGAARILVTGKRGVGKVRVELFRKLPPAR